MKNVIHGTSIHEARHREPTVAGIRIEGLTKEFSAARGARRGQPHRAVDDVSLEVADGDFLVLLGPSGCGKTTLLRMLAGLVEPTSGRILLADHDITYQP